MICQIFDYLLARGDEGALVISALQAVGARSTVAVQRVLKRLCDAGAVERVQEGQWHGHAVWRYRLVAGAIRPARRPRRPAIDRALLDAIEALGDTPWTYTELHARIAHTGATVQQVRQATHHLVTRGSIEIESAPPVRIYRSRRVHG